MGRNRPRRVKGAPRHMSSKRYIVVPEPVFVGIPLSAEDLVRHLVDTDDRFNKTMAGGRAGGRVLSAFEGASPGTVIELHPDDWRLLNESAEAPTRGYPMMRRILREEDGRQRVTEAELIPARLIEPIVDAFSEERTRTAPKLEPPEAIESPKPAPDAAH